MVVSLRERLKVIKNKLGISNNRGEAPEPGKLDGIPVGGLLGLTSESLRESLNLIEEIDNFIGG